MSWDLILWLSTNHKAWSKMFSSALKHLLLSPLSITNLVAQKNGICLRGLAAATTDNRPFHKPADVQLIFWKISSHQKVNQWPHFLKNVALCSASMSKKYIQAFWHNLPIQVVGCRALFICLWAWQPKFLHFFPFPQIISPCLTPPSFPSRISFSSWNAFSLQIKPEDW